MSKHDPSEENTRLAIGLLDDDESTLEEILRLYGPVVIRALHNKYTKRLAVLKYEDIEDVVAIAIHRVWEARKQYDDTKQSLRVWFYCIAENVAKDVLKCGWHRAMRLERTNRQDWLDEKPDRSAPDSGPRTGAEKKESKALADLQEVVSSLPDDQRRIVLADAAARDDVASSDFLADELGIPAAHIRVYRGRAMEKIRKEMRRRGHDIL